jgi:hypothetical protein
METNSRYKMKGVYVVKDANQSLLLYFGLVISSFLCVTGVLTLVACLFEGKTGEALALGLALGIVGAPLAGALARLFFLMIVSRKGGYVVDTNDNTLEFSALGDPDDVSDYFSPTYYKNLISRRKIGLSEITQMSIFDKVIYHQNNTPNFSYYLELQGTFGSISLRFYQVGKRAQLYSYIRSVNNMGIPVLTV